jgi:hypothetical protein
MPIPLQEIPIPHTFWRIQISLYFFNVFSIKALVVFAKNIRNCRGVSCVWGFLVDTHEYKLSLPFPKRTQNNACKKK